jgi:predicted ATP-grasp superfamily ATP-dependent carboligase
MLANTSSAPLTIFVYEWVTGGGLAGCALPPSWASEGGAMRRAIAADFAAIAAPPTVRVIMTLDSHLPDDHGPWVVERVAAGESIERLRQLARSADFTVLVAPETTGVLAQLTRGLNAADAPILGSTAEAIELTGDKARFAARLASAGVDTPRTRIVAPTANLPADAEYPAVLKPVDGAGSLNTFLVPDHQSVPLEARAMSRAILQPFRSGAPMSASFLVGGAGEAHLIGIGAQRIAIRDGRFEYLGGTLPILCPGAQTQLEPAIALVKGLRGFVGIDFLWDLETRHATILEINPRPTTSYVGLSRLLGPGVLARAWLGLYDTASHANCAHLMGLAERVHRQRPVSFDTSGAFFTVGELSG